MVQLGCPALLLDTCARFFMRLVTVPVLARLVQAGMRPRSSKAAANGLRAMGSRPQANAALPEAISEAAYRFFNLPTYGPAGLTLVSAATTLGGTRPFHSGPTPPRPLPGTVPMGRPRSFRRPGGSAPCGGTDAPRHSARAPSRTPAHLDNAAACGRAVEEFFAHRSVSATAIAAN